MEPTEATGYLTARNLRPGFKSKAQHVVDLSVSPDLYLPSFVASRHQRAPAAVIPKASQASHSSDPRARQGPDTAYNVQDKSLSTRKRTPAVKLAPPPPKASRACQGASPPARPAVPLPSGAAATTADSGVHTHADGAPGRWDDQQGRALRAVHECAAPCAVFPKSVRWKEEEAEASAGAAAPLVNLDAAFNLVLPRRAAAFISKAPRFTPSPRTSVEGGEGEEDMDDWQQPRRYQPRWSQPKACAGLGSNPSAQRKPVVTPGVESAVDFTKRHHTQTVLLYRPSVKDQLLQELEKRRQQRQQQQAAAAAAAAPETTGAGSQGQAGSGVAQPQSPDRLRRAQPQPFPSTTDLAAAPQPTYRPAALPAAAAAAIVAAAVCAAHASAVEEHDTVSDGAGFTPHSCAGLSTAAGPAQQLSEGGSPKRADCTSMPHTAPSKTIPARSESADPRLRHSSFSLVHKQAPVVAFAAPGYRAGPETRRSLSAGHGFSREPGPGAYASVRVADMQTALSTTPRQPSTVFGTSPRVLHASQGSWQPSPRALSAWLASDVGAAMDRTRPRAPVAVVPQALSAPVEPSADLRSANATDDEAVPPLPNFDLVGPRVRSVNLMLPAPQPRAATAGELRLQEREEAAAEERLLSDPWAEDAAVRRRVPMWSFSVATSRHGEAEEENCARPLSDLHPNWQLVKPRLAVGVPDFDKLLKPRAALLEDRLRLLKQPAVGMYDVEAGLRLLQRHLPTPLLHLMAARSDAALHGLALMPLHGTVKKNKNKP
ncbi:hypothetical protein QJQ45_001608 [Haematococcus lacustris]|nr:hypothetical protein QJQ45_001608 [Haematococcus lacustris]